MQLALQPYATAGVAIVGAGLIAATPATAPLPDWGTVRDVALTGAWEDAYNTALGNATNLLNNFFLAPGVGLQQFVANQSDFWDQILNDPSTIPGVVEQMQENLRAVSQGYTLLETGPAGGLAGPGDPITDMVIARTLSGEADLDLTGNTISTVGHQLLVGFLPAMLPPEIDPDMVTPIINFLSSPMSGMIMGALGPALSPWVALMNSIGDGDSFSDTLANMFGAFFNGADLNLDWLAPLVNASGLLPEGSHVYGIDLALGGLLSPGVVGSPENVVPGTGDLIAAPGGSIFNSLGLDLDANVLGIVLPVEVPAHAIGPIGALQAWSQTVGVLLGSGWSWDGKLGPQDANPPLAGFDLPQLPDDHFNDGGMGALSSEAGAALDWSDLLAALEQPGI